jgi:hypothetical protein
MTHKLREILRYTHVIAGAALAVVVYSPLIDNDAAVWVARLLLVPVLVAGGGWMWIQSQVWSGRSRAGERQAP